MIFKIDGKKGFEFDIVINGECIYKENKYSNV